MTNHPILSPNSGVRQGPPIYAAHLDLMRGLAALTVMIGHLKFFLADIDRPAIGAADFVAPLTVKFNAMNPAHESVIVFFVLSGALVGGSVLRDQTARLFSWSIYLLKRLTRLLTVLVPALLFGFVIDSSTKMLVFEDGVSLTSRLSDLTSIPLDWKTFLGNLCFLQTLDRTRLKSFGTNSALWSLSFEFWYYVLFPVLVGVVLLETRNRRRVIYVLLAMILGYLLWRDPLSRFPIWLMGALITRLPLFIPERWQRLATVLLSLQFVACAGLLWKYPLSNLLVDDLILGVSCTALVGAILHRQSRHSKNVYARIAEHLAHPSYTLYLFHVPILTFLATWSALHAPNLLVHRAVAMGVIGSTVYLLCYLGYFAFEAHTEKVRDVVARILGFQQAERVSVAPREAVG